MRSRKVIFLIIIFSILLLCNFYNKENLNVTSEKKIVHKKDDVISMMLETEANSGNYEMVTRTDWPTDGYIFNSELSKCENGGELSWDDTNKQVLMTSNISDKCYVYFDKYNPITINNYSINTSGNSITITIDATSGTGAIAKYLYSKDNGVSYVETINNTYTFNGLDSGTYSIKAYVQDTNGKNSEVISKTVEVVPITLANYVISQYGGAQGNNNIYHHDGTLTNGINDGSYRYAGANPNNYVCFGSTSNPCPTDNLYRIIGVFGDQVKLIKDTSASSVFLGTDGDYYSSDIYYYWNYKNNVTTNGGRGSNSWSTSLLNKTNLNSNFINNMGQLWAQKIATTAWKIGGNTTVNMEDVVPAEVYQNEVGSSSSTSTYSAKIGLMYVSDYMYAAGPTAWTLVGIYPSDTTKDYSSATTINWMYRSSYQWTISCNTNYSDRVFYVYGSVSDNIASNDNNVVRPCFYLNADVNYVKGSGTSQDPILIN